MQIKGRLLLFEKVGRYGSCLCLDARIGKAWYVVGGVVYHLVHALHYLIQLLKLIDLIDFVNVELLLV